MTLNHYSLFTLCSHLDQVSIALFAAEFTVTISDNSTVHSTKDRCMADTKCTSLYIMYPPCSTVLFAILNSLSIGLNNSR